MSGVKLKQKKQPPEQHRPYNALETSYCSKRCQPFHIFSGIVFLHPPYKKCCQVCASQLHWLVYSNSEKSFRLYITQLPSNGVDSSHFNSRHVMCQTSCVKVTNSQITTDCAISQHHMFTALDLKYSFEPTSIHYSINSQKIYFVSSKITNVI